MDLVPNRSSDFFQKATESNPYERPFGRLKMKPGEKSCKKTI